MPSPKPPLATCVVEGGAGDSPLPRRLGAPQSGAAPDASCCPVLSAGATRPTGRAWGAESSRPARKQQTSRGLALLIDQVADALRVVDVGHGEFDPGLPRTGETKRAGTHQVLDGPLADLNVLHVPVL